MRKRPTKSAGKTRSKRSNSRSTKPAAKHRTKRIGHSTSSAPAMATTGEMHNTKGVARSLVDLCKNGELIEAVDLLYSPRIVSIEAAGNSAIPQRVEGLVSVRRKAEWWDENHEVHGTEVDGPWPHGNRFIVRFKFDVTAKTGPMAGQRMVLDETALYTVDDGKIVQEEFFYDMGG